MSSICNVISYFPRRLLTVGNLGTQRVINAIDSIAESIIQTTANKLEAFPQSYPRAMDVIEPSLVNLFKFSNNFPKLSTALFSTIITIMAIAQTLLIASIVLVFPSLVIPVGIIAPLYSTFFILATIILHATVTTELEKRYLNRTDDITKLGAAFFNIDPESVSKLNAWAAEQRITENLSWNAIRQKLLKFFVSPSCRLDLSSSQLNSLPDIFDAPVFRNLRSLNLRDNHLTDLPPSIINLQSLTTLNLARNSTLQHLPEAVLQLPSDCTVNINSCNFSETHLQLLGNRVNNPNYNGPGINYSLAYNHFTTIGQIYDILGGLNFFSNEFDTFGAMNASTNASEQISSVEDLLRNLYAINNLPYRELSNLTEIPCLNQWLHKLFNTADFRGELRQSVANKVIHYLERANEDSSYRETFSATILDAVNSCGDRVTLSVLKLGVTYQLSTVDDSDMRRVHHLLTKGTWALDLLHEIARQKISSMRFVDEIEVYLGYPIKLKEELNLPIDVNEMLYFRFSSLTPEDLEIAKNTVLTTLSNEEEHLNFLISQPKWIDTLKVNYREQYRAIEEKRTRASEVTNCNWIEINSVYEQEVKNLTRQVLRLLNL